MARIDTLTNFLTDVSTAIKDKKGDTTPIKASDFDTEITNLPSGGEVPEIFGQSSRISLASSYGNNLCACLINMPSSIISQIKLGDAMSSLFSNCFQLESINLSGLNTSNVKYMDSVFTSCSKLQSIDLRPLDTSKVINTSRMFNNCTSLKNINLSNFNTQNLTDMSGMFANCMALESIDLSNFDTPKLTTISTSFTHCEKITTINLSNINVSKVQYFTSLFSYCYNLTNLDISTWDTIAGLTFTSMFEYCQKLTRIDISHFNFALATGISSMFSNCTGLEEILLPTISAPKITSISNLFYNCSSLKKINISFEIPGLKTAGSTFNACRKLAEIDLSKLNLSTITSFGNMFINCGVNSTIEDGAYAAGIPYIYVKDETSRNWILTSSNGRPSTWSTANVVIAGSADDHRDK